jgi:truncated hemoglobin YjbI
MKNSGLKLGSLALCLWTACSPGQLSAPPPTGSPPVPINAGGATLYDRLGGEAGIRMVVGDFVGRVVKDNKINGYFLNASVDGNRVAMCLVLQVGSLTGGPQKYPSNGCRDMKTIHQGMKISMNDFSDLAGHLVAALQAAGVAKPDIDAIVAAVTPTANDIVEDRNNNLTVYQRVGRKPGIAAVVQGFAGRVLADSRINGFFARANADRLGTCLVRQVCGATQGPCKYGQEVDGEPGVSRAKPCLDMVTVHTGMTSPPGGGAGKPLTIADFNALVEDLITELNADKVPAAEQMALLGALGPLCKQIVPGGAGCP